mmetsp:Transcript_150256/g.265172  ORF Transcript_150256/g.265172 Transcript_150256/m.265172 type:complete len:85 (+) Transcript_150256:372-626(+)
MHIDFCISDDEETAPVWKAASQAFRGPDETREEKKTERHQQRCCEQQALARQQRCFAEALKCNRPHEVQTERNCFEGESLPPGP